MVTVYVQTNFHFPFSNGSLLIAVTQS